jgi:hypothetical protein
VRSELTLSARQPDGATTKDHLMSVLRQTGEAPEQLAAAFASPCPEPLRYLWELWCVASARRQLQGGQPQPLSNTELRNFLELRGYQLSPFEVNVLDRVEHCYLQHNSGAKANV